MSARTRQPAKKQTAENADNRARDRDTEVKLQRKRVRVRSGDFDKCIRDVISENDMSYKPSAELCTTEIVNKWWQHCISGRTEEWVTDVNDFCYRVVESAADIRFTTVGVPPPDMRAFEYFINDKRVGTVIIRNDVRNPITIEIKSS